MLRGCLKSQKYYRKDTQSKHRKGSQSIKKLHFIFTYLCETLAIFAVK